MEKKTTPDDDKILRIFAIAVLTLIVIASLIFWLAGFKEEWRKDIIVNHFAAVIGLPAAAAAAFLLVVLFRQTDGRIEFEVLGFKFKGAAGPLTFWVLCFLAEAFAIWLVWGLKFAN